MLYTKYRPQQFKDLQNLTSVKKTLLSQLKQNKVGHAYLFAGPKGTGKTTTARLMAKAINCEKPQAGEPCLECDNCVALTAGRFLDLFEIDAASNRGIDDVRELREKVKLSPVLGEYKIYIIDEVHMLTKEAFNALLKTLEEPPKHVIFILCTTELNKVPPTVVSRCQKFIFKRADRNDIVERLHTICQEEKASVENEVLEKIAQAASGGYRDAETILEQIITGHQSVEGLVGISSSSPVYEFVESLSTNNVRESLILLNKYFEEGLDMEIFTRGLLKFLRDLLLIKIGIGEKILDNFSEDFERKQNLARKLGEGDLDRLITLCTQVEQEIKETSIPQLPLELMAVRFAQKREPFEENLSSRSKTPENPAKENTAAVSETSAVKVQNKSDVSALKQQWGEILSAIKPHNHSIEALLRSCTIEDFDGKLLTLKTYYKFHKEQLGSGKNRFLLEELLSDFLKNDIKIRCLLGSKEEKKELESKINSSKSTLEVFSGDVF